MRDRAEHDAIGLRHWGFTTDFVPLPQIGLGIDPKERMTYERWRQMQGDLNLVLCRRDEVVIIFGVVVAELGQVDLPGCDRPEGIGASIVIRLIRIAARGRRWCWSRRRGFDDDRHERLRGAW